MAIAATALAAQAWAEPLELSADRLSHSEGSSVSMAAAETPWGPGVAIAYRLAERGWANASTLLGKRSRDDAPVTFMFRTDGRIQVEIKFVYADGSTFGQRAIVEPNGDASRRLTIYASDANYWWGGDKKRGQAASFELALSGGAGAGSFTLARLERSAAKSPASFGPPADDASDGDLPTRGDKQPPLFHAPHDGPTLDPARDARGFGVKKRRAETMTAEDPLVLAWLKASQDASSPQWQLVPSTFRGDEFPGRRGHAGKRMRIRH